MTTGCPSGKHGHVDREAALTALRQARQAVRPGRKAPRQIYRCELCAAWHLTSMSRKQWLMWPGRRPSTT